MRTTSKLLAVALAAALQPAVADTVTVGFEVASNTKASDYQTPGVTFSGDGWVVKSGTNPNDPTACGGYPFSGSVGCGALLLATEAGIRDPDEAIANQLKTSLVINFQTGFVDDVSFLFQLGRVGGTTTVQFFSGLDHTGDLLLTTGLTGTPCDNQALLFCDPWKSTSFTFTGTGRSILISGLDQSLILDQLTLKAASPTNRLPEPTSAALALGALGALGWSRRRARH